MILTLSGDNSWLIQQEIAERTASFLKSNDEFGLERIDGEEASFERIKEALLGQPLFADKKLVIIKRPEGNKQLLEEIEHIISSVSETTDVIFVFSKLDKRASYAKKIQKLTEFRELKTVDTRDLASWLVSEAKARGGSLDGDAARTLLERIGPNQALLNQELDKLLLFNPTITKQMILEQINPTPQTTIFELIDAAFSGNKKKALQIYKDQRELNVEPLAIMGMLAWQLHILLIVATAKDKSADDIAKDAKVHPFVVRKNLAIARRLPLSRLKELVSRALELDIKLKSQAINADDAMQHLLLSI